MEGSSMKKGEDAMWIFRGSWRKRFRWSKLRFELGRTISDGNGNRVWEWRTP